jgi:hypothetical protein
MVQQLAAGITLLFKIFAESPFRKMICGAGINLKPWKRYIYLSNVKNYNSYSQKIYDSRAMAVGLATDYRVCDGRAGVQVPVGSRIFTPACCPEPLCVPPSLI